MVRSLDDPSLEDGVAQLRIQAYPQFPETHDVEFYSSVYRWFERHPLGNEMYRWVAVADDGQNGSRVVGHLAATPQYYRIGGQRVVAYTPCDYMVHYRHGFQAFHLMRMFFRTTENCVACDMVPAVIAVESRLGAEVAGQLQYAAKLLNVSRLPVPPVPSPVRRLLNLQQTVTARGYASRPDTERHDAEEHVAPPLVRPRAPIPAPVKKLLNEGLRIADEVLSSGFGDDLRAEVLEGFDESFDELFEKIAAQVRCVPEKDSAFLRWRYGPGSPQFPVTVLGVKEGGTLLGYSVLMVSMTAGQDGNVLDLTALPGRRDVARALLRESVRFFRRVGAQIVRYRFVESPTAPRPSDLRRLGFFYRRGRRHTLLVKFADRNLHNTANDIANWSYTVGDGEASFWTR
ncbi:MAG: GNAT family N-acetyltransferase [Actinomycetota bacterium]|jgi:hypothetical protein|nr:GNAT family N-acetyltransferase [Actinomycetota bacterium]